MNAPATAAHVQPAGAARAEDLASLDLIRTLVAFDTTSRDSNLALIEWVRHYLEGHGVASTLTFDDDRRKANLFATLTARDVTNSMVVNLAGSSQVAPTYFLNPDNGVSYSIVMQTPQYQIDSLSKLEALPIPTLALVPTSWTQ